jgi:type VI secretion system secreted protein Hcp
MKTVVFAAMLCVAASEAAAAEQVFVNIPSIPGESTQVGHANWIDAFALSHDMQRPGGGSPDFSEVSVLKATDRATAPLHLAGALSTNLGLVTVQVCGTGAGLPSRCYYKIELSNTRVQAISVAESACSGDGCTPAQTESVSFSFTRIKWYYTDPAGNENSRCFDLTTFTSC